MARFRATSLSLGINDLEYPSLSLLQHESLCILRESDWLTMDFQRVYSVLHQVVHVVIRKYLLFFGFVTVRVDAAQVRCANPLSTGANAAIRYFHSLMSA